MKKRLRKKDRKAAEKQAKRAIRALSPAESMVFKFGTFKTSFTIRGLEHEPASFKLVDSIDQSKKEEKT